MLTLFPNSTAPLAFLLHDGRVYAGLLGVAFGLLLTWLTWDRSGRADGAGGDGDIFSSWGDCGGDGGD